MVVWELRYTAMTIQTYLDSRMAKVGSELADVERDLAECIQPATGPILCTREQEVG